MLHIETKHPIMMSSRFGVCLNFYRGLERKGLNSNSQVPKFGSLQLGCNLISKIHERKSPWRFAPQAGNKRDSWTRGTDRSTDSAFCRFSNETFYPIFAHNVHWTSSFLCKVSIFFGSWASIQLWDKNWKEVSTTVFSEYFHWCILLCIMDTST